MKDHISCQQQRQSQIQHTANMEKAIRPNDSQYIETERWPPITAASHWIRERVKHAPLESRRIQFVCSIHDRYRNEYTLPKTCSMTDPAKIAAHRFFDLIPPAMPLEVLEQYGVTVTIPQAQAITKEIVALSIYWIECALQAGIPEQFGKAIKEHLVDTLRNEWATKFGLEEYSFDQFLIELTSQKATWKGMTGTPLDPISTYNQASVDLEERDLVPSGHQQGLLALFLDFVPVEEIGAIGEAIEEGKG